MLIYASTGNRSYASKPVSCHDRRAWEFQAVLRGAIRPVLLDGSPPLQRRRLWLFPPDFAHGWSGVPQREAEVAVFHYLVVPEPLLSLARKSSSPLNIPLSPRDSTRLRSLADRVVRYLETPSPAMMVCHEHALMELSLMMCEALVRDLPAQEAINPSWTTVQRAMEFFSTNMRANPSQEVIARAAGTSPAHLRRLFHEMLQASPKHIFDQLRFQQAMHLMNDTETKLEYVGEACGFGSASAFSRAFKSKFGCSPQSWRHP